MEGLSLLGIKKDPSIHFDCSFCGNSWDCDRSKYKIKTMKTNTKHWKQFISICPVCKRETTETMLIEK